MKVIGIALSLMMTATLFGKEISAKYGRFEYFNTGLHRNHYMVVMVNTPELKINDYFDLDCVNRITANHYPVVIINSKYDPYKSITFNMMPTLNPFNDSSYYSAICKDIQ
jgi:hypothetical protein